MTPPWPDNSFVITYDGFSAAFLCSRTSILCIPLQKGNAIIMIKIMLYAFSMMTQIVGFSIDVFKEIRPSVVVKKISPVRRLTVDFR